jgi:hypothetical protein
MLAIALLEKTLRFTEYRHLANLMGCKKFYFEQNASKTFPE